MNYETAREILAEAINNMTISEGSRWKRELAGNEPAMRAVRRSDTTSAGSISTRKNTPARGFSKRTGKILGSAADLAKGNIIYANPKMRGIPGRPDLNKMSLKDLAAHHSEHNYRVNTYQKLPGELEHTEKHILNVHGPKALKRIQAKSSRDFFKHDLL